jgi:hypothetical protein
MRRLVLGTLVLALATRTGIGHAETAEPDGEETRTDRGVDFDWFPGASTAIARATSASRDTPCFGYALTPYTVVTVGGDLAFFSLRFSGMSLRLGLWGMFELESSEPLDVSEDGFAGLFPMANIALWRGLNGLSLALSFDDAAERWRPGSAIEVALSYRHESEHYTGSGPDVPEEWSDVPHIGDYLMPEVALRVPFDPVALEFRVQLKVFMPGDEGSSYIVGPGIDAIVRWRIADWVHLFSSCFFEYMFGGELDRESGTLDVPDNYLFRNLTGFVFPGRVADFQLFTSISVGHGKGLLATRESFLWGGGFRIVFPSMSGRPRSTRPGPSA